MKKIVIIVFISMLVVTNRFWQTNSKADNNSSQMFDPVLEMELNNIGITSSMLSGDLHNFRDGDFKLTDKIINAIMSDRLLIKYRETREGLKQIINKNETLVFPWVSAGRVRLVNENGNILVELHQEGDKDTSISQGVVFKNAKASIEFDLEPVVINPDDRLEVSIDSFDDSGQPQKIIFGSYRLSAFSGINHIVINLSNNKKFAQAFENLKKNTGTSDNITEVFFRLQGKRSKNNPTIMRLGDLKISYLY